MRRRIEPVPQDFDQAFTQGRRLKHAAVEEDRLRSVCWGGVPVPLMPVEKGGEMARNRGIGDVRQTHFLNAAAGAFCGEIRREGIREEAFDHEVFNLLACENSGKGAAEKATEILECARSSLSLHVCAKEELYMGFLDELLGGGQRQNR